MATQRKKLSVFAEEQGIAYITAYRHWKQGHIEGTQLRSGSILVTGWKDDSLEVQDSSDVIIYARVTSTNQNKELKEQVARLTAYAEERGFNVIDVVEEIGFGFSDHRTKLLSLLYRTDWNGLLVEDREKFASFGFTYFEALLRRNFQEIFVLNELAPSAAKQDIETTPITAEQYLINLIQRTRGVMKTMIGLGSVKSAVEQSINGLLK